MLSTSPHSSPFLKLSAVLRVSITDWFGYSKRVSGSSLESAGTSISSSLRPDAGLQQVASNPINNNSHESLFFHLFVERLIALVLGPLSDFLVNCNLFSSLVVVIEFCASVVEVVIFTLDLVDPPAGQFHEWEK